MPQFGSGYAKTTIAAAGPRFLETGNKGVPDPNISSNSRALSNGHYRQRAKRGADLRRGERLRRLWRCKLDLFQLDE